MKPNWRDTPPGDVESLRQQIRELVAQLGDGAGDKLLGEFVISASGTDVPHNLGRQPNSWVAYNVQGAAIIFQAAPADRYFLYLRATTEVIAGIKVT